MRTIELTDREREILGLLEGGLSDRAISEKLFLTVGTVKWYNRQIFGKLGARNRTHAVQEAHRLGLLAVLPDVESDDRLDVAAAANNRRGNLPASTASFVGRTDALDRVQRLLRSARLVTLTGAPGTGKTRLALEAVARVAGAYPDGAWFVSLAPLSAPDLVMQHIRSVLGVQEVAGQTSLGTLCHVLRERHLLLVLDNFEHLLSAAPCVSELLACAPRLSVLTTSREALHIYGEHEFPVPPLALPDTNAKPSLEELRGNEAVALFIQRAQAALPDFDLDADNAATVAMICVQLDGLPLALELAAARIRYFSPQSLLMRLGSRLETLDSGPRDLPQRQQTLRRTLAWSVDRLEPDEKRLFGRLAVFAGGCTQDDAHAVCGDGTPAATEAGLESLVSKSLVRQERGAHAESRLMLLETMREYALEQMQQNGELDASRRRHALHFAQLAQTYGAVGAPAEWLHWVEAEDNNLREALGWSLAHDPSGQMSLRMIGDLTRFWELKGYLSEARGWLIQALALPGASAHTLARADALQGTGDIAYIQNDYATARELLEESCAICEELGDSVRVARALISLGEIATEVGDYAQAPVLFERAYALARDSGDTAANARALTQLGFGALREGKLQKARGWLEEGLALYVDTHDQIGAALVYSGLGELALRTNRLEDAVTLLQESLAIRRALGQQWGIAASLGSLAWVAMLQEDFAQAQQLLHESLKIRTTIGEWGGIAWCLEKLAALSNQQDDAEAAVCLYGAADALRQSVQSVIDPGDREGYEQEIAGLNAAVGQVRFAALWKEGQLLSLADAIRRALPDWR